MGRHSNPLAAHPVCNLFNYHIFIMTQKDKILAAFEECGLKIERRKDWEAQDASQVYQCFEGAAYIVFDKDGAVYSSHGGYE